MEIIKLIPEQVVYIEKEIERLQNRASGLFKEQRLTDREHASCGLDGANVVDHSISYDIIELQKSISLLEGVLKSFQVLKDEEYSATNIQIGTRFTASLFFDGERDTADYILVHGVALPKSEGVTFVSTDSALGKTVLGKEADTAITYSGPNGNVIIGNIDSIAPNRTVETGPKVKEK